MSGPAQQPLEAAIRALESQRAVLGDAVVEMAIAPLRAQLAALTAPVEPAQTLRQVSILFLDIVGSTTLSQRLDPEEVHHVMDGALTRCTAIVNQHGGKVLQYAGDNLLAVFGAVQSREDDAERAVRCGLALLAEGRLLGTEVLRAHGHAGFDVRVGIHTGGVLLGGGVDAEGSIRGLAVNVAARMEQSAPPGALRISQDTYRQVQGVFEVQAQDPIAVKGVAEPVVTWLVLRARPRSQRGAGRGIDGLHTPLVGREAELKSLQASWLALQGAPRAQRQLIVAEAGFGKSRLLQSLLDWADGQPQRCLHVQVRALPQSQSQPYGLLREVFVRALQIDEADALQARRQIEQGIAPLFEADDGPLMAQAHAHLLGHLLGFDFSDSPHLRGILDDQAQLRSRAFHTAAEMMRRRQAADGRPLLLAVDDLHWADEGSIDFFEHLLRVNHDTALLLLGLTRPALFERRPDWRTVPAGWPPPVPLTALSTAASAELASALLQRLPDPPESLLKLLTQRAEGVPFYMEELVKMLVDQGALSTGPQAWTLHPERLQADALPTTLTGVLQARLDLLRAAERLALQEASVIGVVFWEPALAALNADAPQALPSLQQRALVQPRREAALQGAPAYAFDHPFLREVAYEGVLKRARRELHARAADWLAAQSGARAEGLLGLAAEHYEKAGDAARACEFYARAAEAARQRHAHETTLSCVARALPLADAHEPGEAARLRWRLLDARERTLDLQGRRAEQRADLQALADLLPLLSDDRRRAELATRRGMLALRTGEWPALEAEARQAMADAARAGDEALRLNAQRLLADGLARQGQTEAAQALVEQGLAQARAARLVGLESRFLNALTVIKAQQNDLMGVLLACREATRLRAELGDRRNEAIGLATLGGVWMALGQLDAAEQALDQSLKLHRAVGDRAQEPIARANMSQLALWRDDAELARQHAEAALLIARDVQAPELAAFALWCLGRAEAAAQRPAAARLAFETAVQVAEQRGSAYAHDARAGLARLHLAEGDVGAALAQVERLLGETTAEGATLSQRLIDWTCWQVLQRAGDPRAAGVLQAAYAALQHSAAAIADAELRASLLGVVPENRLIVQAWADVAAATTAAAAP